MEKQLLIYLYNGVLLNNKKKLTIGIYDYMDKSQNDYAKWEKSESHSKKRKKKRLHDSII